jgi:hypothetical protein
MTKNNDKTVTNNIVVIPVSNRTTATTLLSEMEFPALPRKM